SHFSTVFKQRFGMTPGEYRRKFRRKVLIRVIY
ncbi:AraC family transcriptional regulator, partial [Escherichia coli]|nr:AraC family transcriptional regulator [Escherichia coli]